MERLIGEMLAISRMETGSAEVRRERVDLSALLNRRLMQDDEMFRLRGQRLISDLTPGVSVAGDEAMLEKVVGNLLSNAALYSPEGGAGACVVRQAGRAACLHRGECRGADHRRRPAPPLRAFLPGGGLPQPRHGRQRAWGCIW